MEEQRRLGTVVTPGGAISRGALEKGYGGIVAAYMMSLFNERCNGRGGGVGGIFYACKNRQDSPYQDVSIPRTTMSLRKVHDMDLQRWGKPDSRRGNRPG